MDRQHKQISQMFSTGSKRRRVAVRVLNPESFALFLDRRFEMFHVEHLCEIHKTD